MYFSSRIRWRTPVSLVLQALTTELSDTKAALLAAQQAIADLEEEVAGSCGGACVSGSFISSTCTKDKQHVCSVCPDKTFSFGGFPHACTSFRTCAVGSYISEAGTASADVVCTPCEKGKTFSLKEDVSECTECSTKCSKDNFVIDTQCTVTADITCTSLTTTHAYMHTHARTLLLWLFAARTYYRIFFFLLFPNKLMYVFVYVYCMFVRACVLATHIFVCMWQASQVSTDSMRSKK